MQACPGKLNGFHSVLFGLLIFTCHPLLFAQHLIVTEIHRNPSGSETALCAGASHEFIEITNFDDDTFFIDNLFVTDGSESDTVITFGYLKNHESCITDQRFIAPGQIALILDSDYKLAIGKDGCNLPIKSGTVLFRCSDNEIGNGLSDDDGLLLYRGTKNHIDSLVCLLSDNLIESESPTSGKLTFSDPKNVEGRSIVVTSFLFDKITYDLCYSSISPGWLEQMQRGWFIEWKFSSLNTDQQEVACTLKCVNNTVIGSASEYLWTLEKNNKGIQSGVSNFQNKLMDLVITIPVDTVDYRLKIDGTEWLIDMSSLLLPESPVKINEIFPFGNKNESEWIELVNTSSMTINLKNWAFGNSEDTATIQKTEFMLVPGAFVIIAENKDLISRIYPGVGPVIQPPLWHTLNNYGDTLDIFDGNGVVRDRMFYKSSWFAFTNKTIERINCSKDGCDSTNWAQSNQAGTPGYPNDAIFWRNVSAAQMEIGPVPFTPDNDGKNDFLCINLTIPGSQSVRLCIYSFDGRLMKVYNGQAQKKYFWDGKGDNGRSAPCGPFFVVAELTNSKGQKLLRKKGILWR